MGDWTKVGNKVYGTNTDYTKVGNKVYGSDGSQYTKVGNKVYGINDDDDPIAVGMLFDDDEEGDW